MGSTDADLAEIDLSGVDPFWSGPLTDRHAGFAALRRRDLGRMEPATMLQ
jgi:hypothetical protein